MSRPLAYYNEFDPKAAAWLRELIRQRLIMDGDVDERTIHEVKADDLAPYTQCHFFAGIGGWQYALRSAGWKDDQQVWTGSCPCQPFSSAGKRKGEKDERHLWPIFFELIKSCRPSIVFGEQVASKDGLGWLDSVSLDLESENYAFGAADLCAAGIGAPHIRQRLYFAAHDQRMGNADKSRSPRYRKSVQQRVPQRREEAIRHTASSGVLLDDMADTQCRTTKRYGFSLATEKGRGQGQEEKRKRIRNDIRDVFPTSVMGDSNSSGINPPIQRIPQGRLTKDSPEIDGTNATNGFWRDADWIWCTDNKYRAVESGTFPLAHGLPARVGRLRGYGNAIVAPLAKEFIIAAIEAINDTRHS